MNESSRQFRDDSKTAVGIIMIVGMVLGAVFSFPLVLGECYRARQVTTRYEIVTNGVTDSVDRVATMIEEIFDAEQN